MELPPLDLVQKPKNQHSISPRPRNLFGHCYMPASVKKKYVFAATPRNYLPNKNKMTVNESQNVDFLFPNSQMTTSIHTPRPLTKTPAEIRKRMYKMQEEKINIKQMAKEVEELNKMNKRANDESELSEERKGFLDPIFTAIV